MADPIRFEFAIYYLPKAARDPFAALRTLPAIKSKKVTVIDDTHAPLANASASVRVRLEKDALRNYPPPDTASLQYFGRGLNSRQATALQGSREVLILNFAHSARVVWDALRTADDLVERLARETDGLIWDGETREIFTPDAWHERRLGAWVASVPDVATQTVIHVYQTDSRVRSITLGMIKMGLPDVVVVAPSWFSDRPVGNLINAFCQVMAEGAPIQTNGDFDLDLHAIQNSEVRESRLESLIGNATAVARLRLRGAEPEEGDPVNRLVQISAERYTGGDPQTKLFQMISALFGSTESTVSISHTDELLKARDRARAQLPALKQAFKRGLRPAELILVKAPFPTPDGGREWMWVEITSWKADSIGGVLENNPSNVPSLHAGQIVQVREADVFDYIRQLPDGSQEGNETGKIIERMRDTR